MPQIIPIAELRNTSKISDICTKAEEPAFVTKNGHGHLVVMSMDTYERDLALAEVYRKLLISEKQISDGVPLVNGEEVFSKLMAKIDRT